MTSLPAPDRDMKAGVVLGGGRRGRQEGGRWRGPREQAGAAARERAGKQRPEECGMLDVKKSLRGEKGGPFP